MFWGVPAAAFLISIPQCAEGVEKMKALSGGRLRAERAFTLSEGDRHTLNSTYDKFLTLSQEAEISGNYFP